MTGAKHPLVLTDRDRQLLRELSVARIVDREQASVIARFGSTTRANARLLKLTRAGFLKRFFLGTMAGGRKALYTLSPKAANLLNIPNRTIQRSQDSLLVGDQFIEHQLAINSVWIQLMFRPIPAPSVRPIRWLAFPSALSKFIPLIPDGFCELETLSGVDALFCEVDRGTESLRVLAKKFSLYLELASSGEFERLFLQKRFRVLLVLPSERRLETVRQTVLKQTSKIFWLTTLPTINRDGLFAPIWLRPNGGERQSLL